MAQLDNQTKVNPTTSYFGQGGASNLDASTLRLVAGTTSTILETYPGVGRLQTYTAGVLDGEIRIDNIANGIVLGDSFGNEAIFANGVFTCSALSSQHLVAAAVSTNKIDLDGQVLTADPTDLLLNGIPVATISSLSSISSWALDPAISSVQMAGNWMIDVPRIQGYNSSLLLNVGNVNLTAVEDAVSSQFIFDTGAGPLMRYRAGNLDVSSITASNVTAVTFTALSSISVVSTISSLVLEGNLIETSTLYANAFLSTPDIEVSTINGAQFGNSSITVEVVGVSSLVANSISSIGAEIRNALVSTIQFNPSANFSPNLDINLGLGNVLGQLGGAASGILGVVVGGAALGTGIAALAQTRGTTNINSNAYELINGTTQIQISTLGTSFSTIYRFVSSVAENVPGEEYFISSIHAPGVAIRSMSDPLNTVSAPTSTIQSFGQWVALDANLPIPSSVSSYTQLYTSSLGANNLDNRVFMTSEMFFSTTVNCDGGGLGNGITGGDLTNWQNINVGTAFTDAIAGLTTPYVDIFTNIKNDGHEISTSALLVSSINGLPVNPLPSTVSSFNTIKTSTITGLSSINMLSGGLSSIFNLATGTIGTSTLTQLNTDFSLGTNDLFCGQVRISAGATAGEILMTAPDSRLFVYDVDTGDRTLRQRLGANRALSTGYFLDTYANPPFFSTIGGAVNLMAYFPSTSISTIGVSTLSILPTPSVANTSTIAVSSITSIGGVSSIIVVPNTSSFMSMTTVGDVDIVGRDFFAQATTGGVVKATIAVNSSGAGGNGLFALGADVGVGTIYASSITFSTNQVSVRGVPVPQQLYGRSTLSGGSTTVVFSPPYANSNEYSVLLTYKDTAGGNPLHANILSISSFSANGTGSGDFFWQTVGRV